jgi:hypothetical protein
MTIHLLLGVFVLIFFVETAFAQEGAAANLLPRDWSGWLEKNAGLTLDDRLLLRPFADARESGTAAAIARAPESLESRPYLADRGDGIHTSLLGTWVRKQELLVYLFYEYTRTNRAEYKPSDFGFGLDRDFRAKKEEHEALIFLAYGITDRLAVEFESASFTSASQKKASNDPSDMPHTFRESGLGDTEAQIRYRLLDETQWRPELTGFFEVVFPLQENKRLIGTQHWELSLGALLTKGFSWGTITLKASGMYSTGEGKLDWGDYGIEYAKKIGDRWRLVLALEGVQDELEAVAEIQFQVNRRVTIKLNSGFGLTSKAPDFAPEIGVLFSF